MSVGFYDRAPLEDLAEDGLKRPGASAGVFYVGRMPARKFLTERLMAFLHAMGGVFGLILMGMVGYVLAGKGWFGPETRILLPRLITYVALPPYLMSTIMRAFRRDGLLDFIQGALLPLAAVALTFVLAIIIGKIARVQRQHFGLFCASVANSNTIFVGIPVNLALFGEEAVPYVLLYYFASTVFFWTVGQYAITRDIEGEARLIPLRTRVMQIFSPPLLGFLTGLLLILCNVELPFFIQDAARYLGNMTTPLALIFIGITMHDMGLRGITITRDLALALSGRVWRSARKQLALTQPQLALAAGVGVRFVVELEAGKPTVRLVQVLRDYDTPPADIHAVYPQRHAATARVKAFVDFVAQHFNGSAPGI